MFVNIINIFVFIILSVIGPLAHAASPCRDSRYKGDTSTKVDSPLLIYTKLTTKKYKTADDIGVVVGLWNQSSADVYVPRKEGFSIDVSFRIRDRVTGKFLETNFIPALLPPPPISEKDLLKISRCSYVEEKIYLSLMEFNLKAGHRYDLSVEYKSSLPRVMSFGLNVFDSEKKVLISNPILIDIEEN